MFQLESPKLDTFDAVGYPQDPEWQFDPSRKVVAKDRKLAIPILLTTPIPHCPGCGQLLTEYTWRPLIYADVPFGRYTRRFVVRRNRYICYDTNCPKEGKTLPQPLPKSFLQCKGVPKVTRGLYRFIIEELRRFPHTTVATLVGLEEKSIRMLLDYHFTKLHHLPSIEVPEWMGIDDLHLGPPGRKQTTVTVISNVKDHRLCEIVLTPKRARYPHEKSQPRGREKNRPMQWLDTRQLVKYLKTLDQPEQVKYVCIDCSDGYRKIVQKHLSGATLVVDKFHAMQLADKPFFEINKQPMSALTKARDKAVRLLPLAAKDNQADKAPVANEAPSPKKRTSRKSTLNNRHLYTPLNKLKPQDRKQIDEVFALFPVIQDAYNCRLQFRAIWDEEGTRKFLYHESALDYITLRTTNRLLTEAERKSLDDFYEDPDLFEDSPDANYDQRRAQGVVSKKDLAILRFLHWEAKIPASVHEKFKPVATFVRDWQKPIFAYFEIDQSVLSQPVVVPTKDDALAFLGEKDAPSKASTRVTNGYTEALNGLIRIAERASYVRNFHSLRLRAMYFYSVYADYDFLHFDADDMAPGFMKRVKERRKRFWPQQEPKETQKAKAAAAAGTSGETDNDAAEENEIPF